MDAFALLRVMTQRRELRWRSVDEEGQYRKIPLKVDMHLSPEERLALFRALDLVQHWGDRGVTWSVRELAKLTDANVATTASLLRKLADNELLKVNPVLKTEHGSRKPLFLPGGFTWLLEKSAWDEGAGLRRLQQKVLLPEGGYNPCKTRRGGFSRSNRWLLAVLLEHADSHGIVDGLRKSALRALSGMSNEKLRSQFSNLIELGFIHAIVPGHFKNGLFFGLNSVCFLNLHHPYYMHDRFSGITCLIQLEPEFSKRQDFDKKSRERYVLERTPSVQEKRLLSTKDLIRAFNKWNLEGAYEKKKVYKLAECMIDRVASSILSDHWDKLVNNSLSKFEGAELLVSLRERYLDSHEIINDIHEKGVYMEDATLDDVMEHLFLAAMTRAKEIQFMLIKNHHEEIEDFTEYKYVVLPTGFNNIIHRSAFALELFEKRKSSKNFKCILFRVCFNGRLLKPNTGIEYFGELNPDLRYRFGLIDSEMLKKLKVQKI